MKKKTNTLKLGALVMTAVAVGCASPPQDAIDAAKTALQQAAAAEAAEYAPTEFQQAQDDVASLDAELAAQQSRFALMRSYDKATELATSARAAGDRAAEAAAAGRSAAREEATIAVASLRSSIDEVKQMLEQTPTGKGTAADIEAMKADLAGIEGGLDDLEQSLDRGQFKHAAEKARASLASANAIKADITAAIDARKAGRRRG